MAQSSMHPSPDALDEQGARPIGRASGLRRYMQYDSNEESPHADELRDDARLWHMRHIVIGAALWLVTAAVLALLAVEAHSHAEFPGDVGLTTALQHIRLWPIAPLINFASEANWPKPAGIIVISVVVLLLLLRHLRAAFCTLLSGFGADLANVLINGAVARPRPHNTQIQVVAHLGLHSFPSGHVTHVVAFYGFLFYLSTRQRHYHPRLRPILLGVQVICAYFILCIGLSRVLQGAHWPSDVFASYLLGGLVLTLAIALYHVLARIAVNLRQRPAPAHISPER